MIILISGICLLFGLFSAIWLGLKHRYTATEGLLALLVFEIFFFGVAFTAYGIYFSF